jgi:hypothetical protein
LAGVDFKVKVLEATGADGSSKTVKITIWDTGKKQINSMAFYVRMWFLGFFYLAFSSWSREVPHTH